MSALRLVPEVKKIAVIGAGQMGSGIAQVAASAGFACLAIDSKADALKKAQEGIQNSLTKLSEKGKLEKSPEEILPLLRFENDVKALADFEPDLVIEAATESFEIKVKILESIQPHLTSKCIVATNTSSISITQLAAYVKHPEHFVGIHFMNPVPIMSLVELIKGLQTSPEVLEAARSTAEQMGKTCVVAKDKAGFVINRILMPMINEAFFALDEGLATAEDIDTGMKLGTNQPMGPLTLADFIGLDTCLAIMEVLHENLGDSKYRPSPLLRQYVQAGWLGRKSGKGVYRY